MARRWFYGLLIPVTLGSLSAAIRGEFLLALLAIVMGSSLAYFTTSSLATGLLLTRRSVYSRTREPVRFWLHWIAWVGLYLGAVCLALIGKL